MQGQARTPESTIQELARVAHESWRRLMLDQGWTSADAYDADRRFHDALLPFDDLPRRDRLAAVRAVRYDDAAGMLADLIHYARGPDRDFVIDEMRVGLPVVSTAEPELPGQESERGVVVGWQTDERCELSVITVRWEEGYTSDHAPFAQELARVE